MHLIQLQKNNLVDDRPKNGQKEAELKDTLQIDYYNAVITIRIDDSLNYYAHNKGMEE